jgi:hypothetical protein
MERRARRELAAIKREQQRPRLVRAILNADPRPLAAFLIWALLTYALILILEGKP